MITQLKLQVQAKLVHLGEYFLLQKHAAQRRLFVSYGRLFVQVAVSES